MWYMNGSSLSVHAYFQIYAFASMSVVIISTVMFILTTMPELDEFHELDLEDMDNETKQATIQNYHRNDAVS